MLILDYHLQFTFGYQIRFRPVSSGIENVQIYPVVLGFLKRARAGLQLENHDLGFNSICKCFFSTLKKRLGGKVIFLEKVSQNIKTVSFEINVMNKLIHKALSLIYAKRKPNKDVEITQKIYLFFCMRLWN